MINTSEYVNEPWATQTVEAACDSCAGKQRQLVCPQTEIMPINLEYRHYCKMVVSYWQFSI